MTEDEFAALLARVYDRRDEELRARFQRSLPFGDAMTDRWERARKLGFAEGASIYGSSVVYGDVHAGAETWIGPMTLLDGSGGPVRIGSYCSISAGTYIYTHDTVMWAVSGGKQGKRTGFVTISDCVYIGSHCLVLPSVTIGSRVVVAANSLVNRDVPDGTIVAGTPAKAIGRVAFSDDGNDMRLEFDRDTKGCG
jgi:acetyltransferase-like isoleucine patch superfamily enzyme